jgi:hypothetical protein
MRLQYCLVSDLIYHCNGSRAPSQASFLRQRSSDHSSIAENSALYSCRIPTEKVATAYKSGSNILPAKPRLPHQHGQAVDLTRTWRRTTCHYHRGVTVNPNPHPNLHKGPDVTGVREPRPHHLRSRSGIGAQRSEIRFACEDLFLLYELEPYVLIEVCDIPRPIVPGDLPRARSALWVISETPDSGSGLGGHET